MSPKKAIGKCGFKSSWWSGANLGTPTVPHRAKKDKTWKKVRKSAFFWRSQNVTRIVIFYTKIEIDFGGKLEGNNVL